LFDEFPETSDSVPHTQANFHIIVSIIKPFVSVILSGREQAVLLYPKLMTVLIQYFVAKLQKLLYFGVVSLATLRIDFTLDMLYHKWR